MTDTTPKPLLVPGNDGQERWWFDSLATIKARGADTGGALTLIEVTDPPGASAGPFVNQTYDIAYWVLEGAMTLDVDGTSFEARSGDFAWMPHGVPHAQQASEQGCHYLLLTTPGGMDEFALGVSRPAASRTVPPDAGDLDPDTAARLGAQHGFTPVEEAGRP